MWPVLLFTHIGLVVQCSNKLAKKKHPIPPFLTRVSEVKSMAIEAVRLTKRYHNSKLVFSSARSQEQVDSTSNLTSAHVSVQTFNRPLKYCTNLPS